MRYKAKKEMNGRNRGRSRILADEALEGGQREVVIETEKSRAIKKGGE